MSSVKCDTCHKYWEESRHGLYCPECGQTREDEIKRQARDRKITKKPLKETKEGKQARIQKTIDEHPRYGYAKRLTQWLAEYYGKNVKVTFRNLQGGDCTNYSGYSLIRYGYECIDRRWDTGFEEYPTVRHIWKKSPESMTGLESVWAFVLHEFAHALSDNGHKTEYKRALAHLIAEFPFADVSSL